MSEVPFYPNTMDDTRCYQAGIRMVLGHFLPEKQYSEADINALTNYREGEWTVPSWGMIALAKMGFTAEAVQDFDVVDFAKRGRLTMVDVYGEKVTQEQEKHTDIARNQQSAQEYLRYVAHHQREPSINDMSDYLSQHFLVGCNVNSRALNGQEGYLGHFVIVTRIEGKQIIFHDPGLPPIPNRHASFTRFMTAWAYPNKRAKNIMAFRL